MRTKYFIIALLWWILADVQGLQHDKSEWGQKYAHLIYSLFGVCWFIMALVPVRKEK